MSSPISPSPDAGTYVSILPNIKRKAINGGARLQDFDDHLHTVILLVNSTRYSGYTASDRAWHIDLFMWEHFFLEPFPFLGDVDLHPNGNSSTTIIRNPAMPRPFDIIFTTSPRVPLPQTQGRDPRNRFRGLPPPGGFYVPGMVIWYPPPVMGSLTAGGEEMGWQGVMDDEGETGINREVGGGWNGGEMAAPFITPDMSNETPFSASALRHDQKRRRSLPN